MSDATFIIGLDGRTAAPLEYLHWFDERGGVHFRGVHVVEDRSLGDDAVEPETRQRIALDVARTKAAGRLENLAFARARSADDGLEAAARDSGAEGVVIGRATRSDRFALRRLGGVARRMLRRGRTSITIVPPELRSGRRPRGPVLAAIGSDDDTLVLASALTLAQRLDRPLALVRALPVDLPRATDVPTEEAALAQRELPDDPTLRAAERALQRFAELRGAPKADCLVVPGDPATEILLTAHRTDATAIVCGTRPRAWLARVGRPSVAWAVAASSPIPVFVVPLSSQGA